MASKQKIIFFFVFLLALPSWATLIETDLFSINTPDGWSCDPGDSQFICLESSKSGKKSAVIVLKFSPISPSDSINDFSRSLNSPRIKTTADNNQVRSRVLSLDQINLNGQTWVKALHFEGELADYYTYYLGTVTNTYAFLITMSAHEDDWKTYQPIFETVIPSLKVFDKVAPTTSEQIQPRADTNQSGSESQVNGAVPQATNVVTNPGFTKSHFFLILSVLVFGLVLLYALKN